MGAIGYRSPLTCSLLSGPRLGSPCGGFELRELPRYVSTSSSASSAQLVSEGLKALPIMEWTDHHGSANATKLSGLPETELEAFE